MRVATPVDVVARRDAGRGVAFRTDDRNPVESPLPASGLWTFRVGLGTYRLTATYGERRASARFDAGPGGEGDDVILLILAP